MIRCYKCGEKGTKWTFDKRKEPVLVLPTCNEHYEVSEEVFLEMRDQIDEDFETYSEKVVYELSFRDKKYRISICGSSSPYSLMSSFNYENGIREKWWDIQPNEVVMDIGAGYGSYTLPALACGAEVIAIEPGRHELFDLCTGLYINAFFSRCAVMNAMVGDRDCITNYYPKNHSFRPEGLPENRMMFRIDSLNLSKLDWIKVDVEGGELSVVNGAIETIKKYHPKMIIENHSQRYPGIDEEIRKILLPLGYTEEVEVESPNTPISIWK